LYPPKDSPKDWKEDVPQWTYEMWDYFCEVPWIYQERHRHGLTFRK